MTASAAYGQIEWNKEAMLHVRNSYNNPQRVRCILLMDLRYQFSLFFFLFSFHLFCEMCEPFLVVNLPQSNSPVGMFVIPLLNR